MDRQKHSQEAKQIFLMAQMAIKHWQSHPNTPGEPCFAIFRSEKIPTNAPFRYKLIETRPDLYIYAIHAQDILNLFPELVENPKIADARAVLIKQWAS
jgi:hypothetical protein